MLFRQNAEVVQGGKTIGKVDRVVLDPRTKNVAAIVVRQGGLLPLWKVIYLNEIVASQDDRVTVSDSVDFNQLPDFQEMEFVDLSPGEQGQAGYGEGVVPPVYWYPPFGYGSPMATPFYFPAGVEVSENIPKGTLALQEGADVFSADDQHVGSVERLAVDPQTNEVTHFLISRGLLFQKHKRIPAWWVKGMTEGRVILAVTREMLERLPDFED